MFGTVFQNVGSQWFHRWLGKNSVSEKLQRALGDGRKSDDNTRARAVLMLI